MGIEIMDNGITAHDLLRLIGVMAIGVGAAWACQILGTGDSSAFGRMMWVLSAAAVAGGGAGLLVMSASLVQSTEPVPSAAFKSPAMRSR